MPDLFNTSTYHFDLPQDLIAQTPAIPRDSCKLLCVEKNKTGEYQDKIFTDVLDILKAGDVLVLNDSKVLPARLYGNKTTGAHCELLMLKQKEQDIWECLAKPGKRLRNGDKIVFRLSSFSIQHRLCLKLWILSASFLCHTISPKNLKTVHCIRLNMPKFLVLLLHQQQVCILLRN